MPKTVKLPQPKRPVGLTGYCRCLLSAVCICLAGEIGRGCLGTWVPGYSVGGWLESRKEAENGMLGEWLLPTLPRYGAPGTS